MSDAAKTRIETVLKPVPGDAPAGRSARYDPEFETLKAEADKIGSLAAATVDWQKIGTLAEEILEKKSKDLLAMSYFCLALFQTAGYPALSEGLGGMRRMIEEYWDRLFPEANRLRARVGAIEWLVERSAAAVQKREPGPSETDAVAGCLESLDALDACLREKLLSDAPSLGDLRGALNERLAAVPSAASEPAATAPATVAARAAVAPAAERDLSSAETREETLKESLESLRSLAVAIRRADPRDPMGYRLARVAAWGRVRGTPPDTDGTTSVPAFGASPDTLDRFSALAGRGDWSALLEQSESQFLESVLWLDVHRFSVQALRGLGREYERAERVILHEVGLHVRAFPRMLELTFNNGTPFASGETRSWIEQEVLGGTASAESAVTRGETAPGASQDEALEHAATLARGGKVGEAVGLLVESAERLGSARERFVRRIALARLLADAREIRAAVAQMERVEADLGRFGVEEWEPGLAVEALSVHLRLQRALAKIEGKGATEIARKVEDLYARLARLDARAALAMKS